MSAFGFYRKLQLGLTVLTTVALIFTCLSVIAAISEHRRQVEKPSRYKCSYFAGGAVRFGFGSVVLIAGTIFTSRKLNY